MVHQAVWRHYDQAELDRQYNSRGTVPDVTAYLRDYTALTLQAKSSLGCAENLAWGEGADETLDIYPTQAPNAPVMVFLHGGDWRALSKDDGGFAAPAFSASGVLFVTLNFSLVPQVSLPDMGAQVRRALVWLWHNVAAHGGDPQRLHVAGHSSGANLVGQLLMTKWTREFGLSDELIKSALMISGLGDLEPVRLSFRNQALGLSPAVVECASLLRQKPPARCPLLVAVGEKETQDYRRQSRELAAYWQRLGNQAELMEIKGRHHFDVVLDWADAGSDLFRCSRALLK